MGECVLPAHMSCDRALLLRCAASFRTGFLCTGGFFFTGGFFLVGVEAPRSVINWTPIGEPRPVQASQPGPAENAPLFPDTISLKADAAFAA